MVDNSEEYPTLYAKSKTDLSKLEKLVTLFIGKDTGHTWAEVLRAIPRAQASLLISCSRCYTMPSLPVEAH